MTEPEFDPQPGPVVKATRDLREIERMAAGLQAEAENASGDRLMPGGRAMVLLAPVANLEAWENLNEATERYGKAYTSAEDEDPDEAWSAFQLLKFWSEDWRRQHDADYGQRPTIVSEAAFIRHMLGWAWENVIEWDDMAKDIRTARLKIEDIVNDGRRADRTRVTCPDCETEEVDEETGEVRKIPGPRLVRVYASDEKNDGFKCPRCKRRYDQDDYKRAYSKQLRSEGAERYVPMTDALDTLRSQGRPERTIRKWLLPVEDDPEHVVHGYCEVRTRRVLLWWPDLWTRHLTTQMRDRLRKSA